MNSSSRRDINSRMVNLGKRQQEFREIMDMIANLFLRAKHWQMFLLFAGVAFIGDVVALASISQLDRAACAQAEHEALSFRAGLSSALCLRIHRAFSKFHNEPGVTRNHFPVALSSRVLHVYDLYFVSKSLALAETSRPVSFYDYAGPFFLIWFFPIGIWFTQPRVNRLYAERKKNSNH